MSTPSIVHAKRWEYTSGFFTDRMEFVCGSCVKLNHKNEVFPVRPRGYKTVLVGSQCRWCGDLNAFRFSPNRYLVVL